MFKDIFIRLKAQALMDTDFDKYIV